MLTDLVSMRSQLAAGQSSAAAELERCIARRGQPACAHVFRQTCLDEARAAAAAGRAALPLAGLAVSVKDLFDGQGCPRPPAPACWQGAAPATADCRLPWHGCAARRRHPGPPRMVELPSPAWA